MSKPKKSIRVGKHIRCRNVFIGITVPMSFASKQKRDIIKKKKKKTQHPNFHGLGTFVVQTDLLDETVPTLIAPEENSAKIFIPEFKARIVHAYVNQIQ